MYTLLDILLRRIVQNGALTFIDAGGVAHRYGDGRGSPIVVRIADKRLERHLVLDPQMALGEGYMQGRLKMVEGRIYDFLELLLTNIQRQPEPAWTHSLNTVRYLVRRLMQFNPSGVQMVGRLPGIVTTAPDGATGPLTGMAALALATLAVASTLALAFAAAVVLAEVCFCNLSSFCSSRRSCCRNSAISESLLPVDSARACETNNAPIRLAAVAIPVFVLDMRASPFSCWIEFAAMRRTGVSDCTEIP